MSPFCESRYYAPFELNHFDRILDVAFSAHVDVDRGFLAPSMSREPDERLMLGCALGNEECCAIRDSWQPALPITMLSPDDYDKLLNTNTVVFHGSLADRKEVR
jgi:hypothetical protein